MAHSWQHGHRSRGMFRLILVMLGVFLFGSTVGPPLGGHLKKNSSVHASCSCVCECSSELEPELVSPLGTINGSFTDCGKHDPKLNEEMEKSIVALLSEELTLQKTVVNETLQHSYALIMNARKASAHYQSEAEKCNAGIETCENARERAERELIVERRITALWENRARECGWKDT